MRASYTLLEPLMDLDNCRLDGFLVWATCQLDLPPMNGYAWNIKIFHLRTQTMNAKQDFANVTFSDETITLKQAKVGEVVMNGQGIERAASPTFKHTLASGPAIIVDMETTIDFATFAPFISVTLMDENGKTSTLRIREKVAGFINTYVSV